MFTVLHFFLNEFYDTDDKQFLCVYSCLSGDQKTKYQTSSPRQTYEDQLNIIILCLILSQSVDSGTLDFIPLINYYPLFIHK